MRVILFLVPEIFWDFQWLNCHPFGPGPICCEDRPVSRLHPNELGGAVPLRTILGGLELGIWRFPKSWGYPQKIIQVMNDP